MLAFRCRIVLAAAEGRSSSAIAAELGCNGSTVGKWRGRFARGGIDGLHDEPRPEVIAEMTPRHRAEEFRRFLNLIDAGEKTVPRAASAARR